MGKYYYEKCYILNRTFPVQTLEQVNKIYSPWSIRVLSNAKWEGENYVATGEIKDLVFVDPKEYNLYYLNFMGYSNGLDGKARLHDIVIQNKGKDDAYWEESIYSYIYKSDSYKGDYIETVIAENGEYPDDGVYNGYWYIKKGLAFPEFKIKVNGELKTSKNGWVKINGQLKQIDKIWTKINGVLREV